MQLGIYVVLPHSGDRTPYRMAEYLVRSAQDVMPDVAITQFTDLESPALAGVAFVQRRPLAPMALHRSQLYGSVDGDWLFVDADVVIQKDVRDVFDQAFDVAFSDREWPHLTPTPGLARRMPFNAGVAFSRCPAFWQAVHQSVTEQPILDAFMGDQRAIAAVVGQGTFNVLTLPGVVYNYPPAVNGDDLKLCRALKPQAAIVHYKGPKRKKLLLREVAA